MQYKKDNVTLKLDEENIINGSTVYEDVWIQNAAESYGQNSPSKKISLGDEMSLEKVNSYLTLWIK